MKTFNLNLAETSSKDLSELNEPYIKLKHISSENFANLEQQFIIRTSYPDGTKLSKIISSGAYITPYTREPKIDLNFPIEDCQWSTIEALLKDKDASYTFFYEDLSDILIATSTKEGETNSKIKQEVANWISKVNELFDQMINWLVPYGESIKITKGTILLTEELSGTYSISTLEITILDKTKMRFEPFGTFIIGGKGRIDITINLRQFDSYRLILQPINNFEKWFLIKNRDNVNKKEFTQSQLLILIDNAIGTKS